LKRADSHTAKALAVVAVCEFKITEDRVRDFVFEDLEIQMIYAGFRIAELSFHVYMI